MTPCSRAVHAERVCLLAYCILVAQKSLWLPRISHTCRCVHTVEQTSFYVSALHAPYATQCCVASGETSLVSHGCIRSTHAQTARVHAFVPLFRIQSKRHCYTAIGETTLQPQHAYYICRLVYTCVFVVCGPVCFVSDAFLRDGCLHNLLSN